MILYHIRHNSLKMKTYIYFVKKIILENNFEIFRKIFSERTMNFYFYSLLIKKINKMKMNAIVMIILLSISLLCNLSSSTKIKGLHQKQNLKLVFPQIEQPYEPETVSKLPKIEPPKYDEEDEEEEKDDMHLETNSTINEPILEETPKIYSMVVQAKPTSIIHSVKRDGKMVIPSPNLIQGLGKVKVLNDGRLQIPVDIANNPVTDPILRNTFENPKFVPKEELIETKQNTLINNQKKIEENESLLEPEDFILTEDEDNRKIKLAETHKTDEEKIAALYQEKERIESEMRQLIELILPHSEKIKKSKQFVNTMQKILKQYTKNRIKNNSNCYSKTREEIIEELIKEIEGIKEDGYYQLPYLRNLNINQLKKIMKELKKNMK